MRTWVAAILVTCLSVGSSADELAPSALDPADAVVRDFQRWNPSLLNPSNDYTWGRARADFNGDRLLFWASGLTVLERRGRIVSDPGQGRVLRVKYPAGKFGSRDSGVSFPWLLNGRYEELYLRYRVKFDAGFQFTTSGKLPGLCGANDTLGCYRYTGGHPPRGDDGFSVRVVWLNNDGLVGTYVYHAGQGGQYGDIFVWQNARGEYARFTRGAWHTVELRVRLNEPGRPNGEAEAWFDGESVSLVDHLLFRDASEKGRAIKINEMYFNTFHGGNDAGDAPAQTQYSFFDDFKLHLVQATDRVR